MEDLKAKVADVVYNPNTGKYEKGKHGPDRKVKISNDELAELRKCMSVNVMAEYLGVSRGTVYKYLRCAGLVKKDNVATQKKEK